MSVDRARVEKDFEAAMKRLDDIYLDVHNSDEQLGNSMAGELADVRYAVQQIFDLLYEQDCEKEELENAISDLELVVQDTVHVVTVEDHHAKGLHTWCMENIDGEWYRLHGNRMAFERKDMAALFKLRWA